MIRKKNSITETFEFFKDYANSQELNILLDNIEHCSPKFIKRVKAYKFISQFDSDFKKARIYSDIFLTVYVTRRLSSYYSIEEYRSCSFCGKSSERPKIKRGFNRGRPNYNVKPTKTFLKIDVVNNISKTYYYCFCMDCIKDDSEFSVNLRSHIELIPFDNNANQIFQSKIDYINNVSNGYKLDIVAADKMIDNIIDNYYWL